MRQRYRIFFFPRTWTLAIHSFKSKNRVFFFSKFRKKKQRVFFFSRGKVHNLFQSIHSKFYGIPNLKILKILIDFEIRYFLYYTQNAWSTLVIFELSLFRIFYTLCVYFSYLFKFPRSPVISFRGPAIDLRNVCRLRVFYFSTSTSLSVLILYIWRPFGLM